MFLTTAADIVDESVLTVTEGVSANVIDRLAGQSERKVARVAVVDYRQRLARLLEMPGRAPFRASEAEEIAVDSLPEFDSETAAFAVVQSMLKLEYELATVHEEGRFLGLVTRWSVTAAFGELAAS